MCPSARPTTWSADTGAAGGKSGPVEAFWEGCLERGLVPDTALARKEVRPRRSWPAADEEAWGPAPPAGEGLEIVFRPDPGLYDGRFANNGWLQEWPRPLTRLTWDNAVLMSLATAQKLDVWHPRSGVEPDLHAPQTEVVTLTLEGREPVEAPVWVMPGMPDGTVTVHLGFGRTHGGSVAPGVGFSAYRLRSSAAPWSQRGLKIEKAGRRVALACVQHHNLMEGRDQVREALLDEQGKNPRMVEVHHHRDDDGGRIPLTLYPEVPYNGHRWAMAIDVTACTGCGACVVACQAENNIPVVGKDQVVRGRAMHWLRVDRYYSGELEEPDVHFQPVPCMHCENAPCEPVCPVVATVHSDEGLNDMVYNRCVGTRYCSNNCPYKVRRFNFLEYGDRTSETLKL